jgi:hypothetical protein
MALKQPSLDESPVTKSVALVEQQEQDAPVTLMFERLAKDPAVDVEKLERLIAMQERIMRHQAKAAFDAAFAEMQGELPEIGEKGQIIVDGKVRSTYALNEDIQRAIKPILQRHGFSLRFRNEWAEGGKLKIIGILSHRSGHSEQDEFVAGADTSGSKNAIQAIGSTRAYGQRYCTVSLLNLATHGIDDDGEGSEKFKTPEPPPLYSEWLLDMHACADEGRKALSAAWNKATKEYRDYATKHDRATWTALKARASSAGA